MSHRKVIVTSSVNYPEDGAEDVLILPPGAWTGRDEEVDALRTVYPDLVVRSMDDRLFYAEPEGMDLSWTVHEGMMIEEDR